MVRRVLLAAYLAGLAVSISLAEVSLAALALVVAADSTARRRLTGAPLVAPVAAFAAWTLVAALAAARPGESLAAARSLLLFAAFWVVLAALPSAREARRFLGALLALAGLVALLAAVQVAACPAPGDAPPALLARFLRKCERARGFYSIYMTLAGVLTLVTVAAFPRLAGAGFRPIGLGAAWVASVGALALTYVRGAWLGFAVGVGGLALAARVRRRALALAAVVVVAALVALPGVLGRVRTIADPADATARERVAMLRAGLALARDHPLTGVGPGQVKHLYPVYAPPEAVRRHTSHLHNAPLQILVERGLPGLAAWLAIWVAFFRATARALRRVPDGEDRALVLGPTAAVGAFLVAGLFEHNFGDSEVLLVALSLMALPVVAARDHPG